MIVYFLPKTYLITAALYWSISSNLDSHILISQGNPQSIQTGGWRIKSLAEKDLGIQVWMKSLTQASNMHLQTTNLNATCVASKIVASTSRQVIHLLWWNPIRSAVSSSSTEDRNDMDLLKQVHRRATKKPKQTKKTTGNQFWEKGWDSWDCAAQK